MSIYNHPAPSKSKQESPWIWRTGAFAGEFGDAFIRNTNLEGGQVGRSIRTILDLLTPILKDTNHNFWKENLSLFEKEEERDNVKKIFTVLEKSAARDAYARTLSSGGELFNLVTQLLEDVTNLPIGEELVVIGGWISVSGGHAVTYVVERISKSKYAFVVCNTGDGATWHPAAGTDYPKEKRVTSIRIPDIPASRLLDETVWYLLLKIALVKHKSHTPAQLYEVILPHIAGSPSIDLFLREELEKDTCGDFETLQRSGTCFFRCALTCIRYLGKKYGFSVNQRKQLMFSLRLAFIQRTRDDLLRLSDVLGQNLGGEKEEEKEEEKKERLPEKFGAGERLSLSSSELDIPGLQGGWVESDLRMVLLGINQLGYSAVKMSKKGILNTEGMEKINQICIQTENLAKNLPFPGGKYHLEGLKKSLGMEEELKGGQEEGEEIIFATETIPQPFQNFELLAENKTTDYLAGGPTEATPDLFVDLLLPSSLSPSSSLSTPPLTQLLGVLQWAKEKCQKLRGKSTMSNASVSLHQICSLLERIVAEVIPLPPPMLSPQQKDEKRMREEKVEGEKGNEKREKVREGEAFWDALEEQEEFKLDDQREAVELLYELAIHYISASYSLSCSREADGSRVLVVGALFMLADRLVRIQATDEEAALTKALLGKITPFVRKEESQEENQDQEDQQQQEKEETSEEEQERKKKEKETEWARKKEKEREQEDYYGSGSQPPYWFSFKSFSLCPLPALTEELPCFSPSLMVVRWFFLSYFGVPPEPVAERGVMGWVGGEPGKKEGWNFRVKCEDGMMLVVNSLMTYFSLHSRLPVQAPKRGEAAMQTGRSAITSSDVEKQCMWMCAEMSEWKEKAPEYVFYRDFMFLFKLVCEPTQQMIRHNEWFRESRVWFTSDFYPRWKYRYDDPGEKTTAFFSVSFASQATVHLGHSLPPTHLDAHQYLKPKETGGKKKKGGPLVPGAPPPPIPTEEDVRACETLQTFDNHLSEEDSEKLISFLTVPHLAPPLVLSFFAARDRTGALVDPALQAIVEGCLFFPRQFAVSPSLFEQIPVESSTQLGTPFGLLLHEVLSSPDSLFLPLFQLLSSALYICPTSPTEFRSVFVPVLLFATRLSLHTVSFYQYGLSQGLFSVSPSSASSPSHLSSLQELLEGEVRERFCEYAVASQKSGDLTKCVDFHSLLALLQPVEKYGFGPWLASSTYTVAWHGGDDLIAEDKKREQEQEQEKEKEKDYIINNMIGSLSSAARPQKAPLPPSPPLILSHPPTHLVFYLLETRRKELLEWVEKRKESEEIGHLFEMIVQLAVQQDAIPSSFLSWLIDSSHSSLSSSLSSSSPSLPSWQPVTSNPLQCSLTLESPHPYPPSLDTFHTVSFPGASHVAVFFDPECHTEIEHDYVTIYRDTTYTTVWGEESYSGDSKALWPGCHGRPPLVIPADHFVVHFHSDATDEGWGFRLTALAPVSPTATKELMGKYPSFSGIIIQEALAEANNDIQKAIEILQENGAEKQKEKEKELEENKQKEDEEEEGGVKGLYRNVLGDIRVNLQSAEVFLANRTLVPTHSDIATHPHFCDVFGGKTPYCAVISNQEKRRVIRIVDGIHIYEVQAWLPIKAASRAEISAARVLNQATAINVEDDEDNKNNSKSEDKNLSDLGAIEGGFDPYGCLNLPAVLESDPDVLVFSGAVFSKYETGSAGWLSLLFDAVLDEAIIACAIDSDVLIWQNDMDPYHLVYYCPATGSLEQTDGNPGLFYEVKSIQKRQVFHVYAIVEHGRKAQRELVYTSDVRYCLHHMQQEDTEKERDTPCVVGTENSAGNLFGVLYGENNQLNERPGYGTKKDQTIGNLVISRTRSLHLSPPSLPPSSSSPSSHPWFFAENEGKLEEFVPGTSLFGLLPDALVEGFQFWKTGEKSLRGYPKSGHKDSAWWEGSLLFVRLIDNNNEDNNYTEGAIVIRVRLVANEGTDEVTFTDPMLLHNSLFASTGSSLEKMANLMSELDSFSHLLFWSSLPCGVSSLSSLPSLPVCVVELPRIHARFAVEYTTTSSSSLSSSSLSLSSSLSSSLPSGQKIISMRSLDHDGWVVHPGGDSDPLVKAYTEPLPHSLVLKNRFAETALMVPNYGISRPEVKSTPFTTIVTTDRSEEWSDNVRTRFYVYPLHTSGAFLRTDSLGSALYMFVVRLFKREYISAAKILPSCQTDTSLSEEEKWILCLIKGTNKDRHPDAHALRLRMALVCYESGCVPIPWDPKKEKHGGGSEPSAVEEDFGDYLKKYEHVSAICRLSESDERKFIESRNREMGEITGAREKRLAYLDLLAKAQAAAADAEIAEEAGEMEKAKELRNQSFGPMEVKMKAPDQTGSRMIFFLKNLVPRAVAEISSGAAFGVLCKYNRPNKDQMQGVSAFDLLNVMFDDDMMGYHKQTGFLLIYEMLTNVVNFKLTEYKRPTFEDEEEEQQRLEQERQQQHDFERQEQLKREQEEKEQEEKEKEKEGQEEIPSIPPPPPPPSSSSAPPPPPSSSSASSAPPPPPSSSAPSSFTWAPVGNLGSTFTLAKLVAHSLFIGFFKQAFEEKKVTSVTGIEIMLYTMIFVLIKAVEDGKVDQLPPIPYAESQPSLGAEGVRMGGVRLRQFTKKLVDIIKNTLPTKAWKEQPVLAPKRQIGGTISYISVTPGKNSIFCRPTFTNYSQPSQALFPSTPAYPSDHPSLCLSEEDVQCFSSSPLAPLDLSQHIEMVDAILQKNHSDKLPFDLSSQPCSQSPNGKARLGHLQNDMKVSSQIMASSRLIQLTYLTQTDVHNLTLPFEEEEGEEGKRGRKQREILRKAWGKLEELVEQLREFQETENKLLRTSVRQVEEWANVVNSPTNDKKGKELSSKQMEFLMMRRAGLRVEFWFEALCGSLMSTEALVDIKRHNPFVDETRLRELKNVLGGVLCRSVRLNQINRCISRVTSLQKDVKGLLALCSSSSSLSSLPSVRVEMIKHAAADVAKELSAKRHFTSPDSKKKGVFQYDPRYLVFEYSSGYLLRKRQVDLIDTFLTSLKKGESLVHQMIMGAGKTTVIGPLLSLLLTNGSSLVTLVVPGALLEQSRSILRSCFSHVINKPVYTLSFERSGEGSDSVEYLDRLYWKLERARVERAIVTTTPEAVKSLFLKYLDLLQSVEAAHPFCSLPKSIIPGKKMRQLSLDTMTSKYLRQSKAADCIKKILSLWGKAPPLSSDSSFSSSLSVPPQGDGIVLIDEVDLVLHPLKSETNFPIGQREPLDLSPERWEAAFHILDAIFFRLNGRVSLTDFHPEKGALMSLDAIATAMTRGEASCALQKSPHTVLLQRDFYEREMKTHVARWGMVWLEQQQAYCEGVEQAQKQGSLTKESFDKIVEDYLCGETPSIETRDFLHACLSKMALKFLNLMKDWVTSFLPFCMGKINRVSYGILQPSDLARWNEEIVSKMMNSRKKLAVPFIGKDVPSEASEFAHPEVLIGLTVLAYRYEGLRTSDLIALIKLLKEQMNEEVGPYVDRPSRILFEEWVNIAQSSHHPASQNKENGEEETKEEEEYEILPLELIQVDDVTQLKGVTLLLSHLPEAIEFYLCRVVFPEVMQHQSTKLQASGYDLGSDMLFANRLGFSGTPTDIVPRQLKCIFEAGDDSKIIRVLTSPETITHEVLTDWSVNSLLQHIATNNFRALIDTGALITGFTNEQVARKLLEYGLEGLEACVFLDERDQPMVVDRTAAPPVPLNRSGIQISKRFTFYDQVHTTGMDIKQAIDARAAVTLGKDMTLRDYAQGCWRMRGLDCGQTVHVLVVKEVSELIDSCLKTGRPLIDMCAWLLCNSLASEELQYMQLCQQEISHFWRKRAVEEMKSSTMPKQLPSRFLTTRFKEHISKEDVVALFQEYSELLGELPEITEDRGDKEREEKEEKEGQEKEKEQSPAPGPPPPQGPNNPPQPTQPTILTPLECFSEKQKKETERGQRLGSCVQVFKEPLGLEICDEIPLQRTFVEKMREVVQSRSSFILSEEEKEIEVVFNKLSQMDGGAVKQGGNTDYDREMVQQQEQQKSKQREVQQQKQKQVDFGEGKDQPRPWPFSYLSRAIHHGGETQENEKGEDFASKIAQIAYPLSSFHFTHQSPSLPFPSTLFVTNNHTGHLHSSDLPRRLRNVYVLGTFTSGSSRYSLILSLKEAESLRRAVTLRPSNNVLQLTTSTGLWLTPPPSVVQLQEEMDKDMQCARFFNNEMTFSDKEVVFLLKALSSAGQEARQAFFEEVMRGRRRSRVDWTGTPIGKFFSYPNEETLENLRKITLEIRAEMSKKYSTLVEAFQAFDANRDGWLSSDEVEKAFVSLKIALEPHKLAQLMQHADQNSDGFLNLREFAAHFAVDIDPDAGKEGRGAGREVKVAKRTSKSSKKYLDLMNTLSLMSNTATENKSNNNNSSNSDSDAATHMRIKTLKTLGRHALVSSGEVNFGCDDVVSMVEGSGNDVSSVGFQGVALVNGCYYYEVSILQGGNGSVGWAGGAYAKNGVGEDKFSFGLGPEGLLRIGGVSLSKEECGQLPSWEAGDVICCSLSLNSSTLSLEFALNGKWDQKLAYASENTCLGGIAPMVSFKEGFVFKMNAGATPLCYTPPKYQSVHAWVRSRMAEMYAAEAGVGFGKLVPHAAKQEVLIEGMAIRPDPAFAERVMEGSIYEARSIFPTVRLGGVLLTKGKWYYEVVVNNPGVGQIGWVDVEFWAASRGGVGVGDDKHSWAFDGNRRLKWWAQEEKRWGGKWKYGDVVGCACDLEAKTMSFSLNGSFEEPMGVAFSGISYVGGVTPGITLQGGSESNFSCTINTGETTFRYPPPAEYLPVWKGIQNVKNKHIPLSASPSKLMVTSGGPYTTVKVNELVVTNHFSSFKADCRLQKGKWYFEVKIGNLVGQNELFSSVVVGFVTKSFFGNSVEGRGVGDDDHGIGFDDRGFFKSIQSQRSLKKVEKENVMLMQEGDVIGCGIDFEKKTISLTLKDETIVVENPFGQGIDLFPAISLGCSVKKEAKEMSGMGMGSGVSKHAKKEESVVIVNFGEEEFKLAKPEGYQSIIMTKA